MAHKEIHSACDIPLKRKVSEILWYAIMRYASWSETHKEYHPSHIDGAIFGVNSNYTLDTDHFTVRSYSWEDADAVDPQNYTLSLHKNDWHFYHKSSGLKIQWYKYPLREAYTNMEITDEELCDVLYDCQNYLHPHFIIMCDEWWRDC